jgi:glycosyltransferase involved in cell wall biosynthesis
MYASDIFLNTSINEGMSGAILEAMAESLPVIATRNSGNAALVDNNENGFLVLLNDQEDLIEKLLRLISDKELRNNMGAKGRDKVEKYYTSEQEIDRLLKVYEKVLLN